MPDETPIPLKTLSKMIDHSLLHPTMTDKDILDGCALARKYETAAVCVKPYAVTMARDALGGSGVGVCSVIAFPHGNSTTGMKVVETVHAIQDGAAEIDAVINIGKALGGDWDYVSNEIRFIKANCFEQKVILKVILETDYLKDEQIVRLCEICSGNEVDFVKTSTGYGFVKQPNGFYSYAGATEHNVALMRAHSNPRFRALGVSRIGATATEAILEEAKRRGSR
jgi:deoxyribose-phosphate aldolase